MARTVRGAIERVAMISLHTSPLDQPGTGDAGGLNVYVTEAAREMAARGIEVDIFTRATASEQPRDVVLTDGVTVRNISAGPFEELAKEQLPAQLCSFAREVLRVEAGGSAGPYDVVHSHYWLSGHVGALARDRWEVPLVHTMHTMAKVKNSLLADGDLPEPRTRVIGEEQVVRAADLLVANTDEEAKDLINFYDADAARVEVVHPGVDLAAFAPRPRSQARQRLNLAQDVNLLLFVGRIQPLKAPDLVLRAARILRKRRGGEALTVAIVGGQSGTGWESPESLGRLADDLGIGDAVRFVPPVDRDALADWYAASNVVCVPSYNESFGLVALEAEAMGIPVVAAAVGGLTTAVRDDVSGLLVATHEPADYADAIARILEDRALATRLGEGGRVQASDFTWQRTADRLLEAYADARQIRTER